MTKAVCDSWKLYVMDVNLCTCSTTCICESYFFWIAWVHVDLHVTDLARLGGLFCLALILSPGHKAWKWPGDETALVMSIVCIFFFRSAFQRWLKLSSAYAESPLRVGCLEWPLRISPSHSLQLQSAAAIKALNPIKSRHAQVQYMLTNVDGTKDLWCSSTVWLLSA